MEAPLENTRPCGRYSRIHLHHLNKDLHDAIIEHLTPDAFANLLLASKTTNSLLQYAFPSKAIFRASSRTTSHRLMLFHDYLLASPKTRGLRLRELVVEEAAISSRNSSRDEMCARVRQILRHAPNLRVFELHRTDAYLDVTGATRRSLTATTSPLFAGFSNLAVLKLFNCPRELSRDAFQSCDAPLRHVEISACPDRDVTSAFAPFAAHLRSLDLDISMERAIQSTNTQPRLYVFEGVKRLSLRAYTSHDFDVCRYAAQFPNITHLFIHCNTPHASVLKPAPLGSWPSLLSVEGDWLSVDALPLPASLHELCLYIDPPRQRFASPPSDGQRYESTLARVLRKAQTVKVLELRLDGIPKEDTWSILCEITELHTLRIVCTNMWTGTTVQSFLV